MELLSPAGSYENAIASIKAGCNALYLGGKEFSARMSSLNFSREEIKDIVLYAHLRNVKVYVTINTLIYQDEFASCVEFCRYLHKVNVDALIVQDIGLAYYLNKTLPNLELHASTQLNCHNIEQAKALKKIGFKRIVIAREGNIKLIREIKALGLEVEVFIHGALCVSYSGNCLMSSFIGGRSGNRGRCAQPCRLNYSLIKNGEELDNKFLISTKDLMTLDYISILAKEKVESLKIEGRLKSSEYTYITTNSYRHAIDSVLEMQNNPLLKQDKENLIKIFSRKFTKGYLFDESPFNLLNQDSSSHQGEVIGKVTKVKKNSLFIQLKKSIHRLDGIRFNNSIQYGLQIGKMFINSNPVEEASNNQIIEIKGIENPNRFNNVEVIRTSYYRLIERINKELKEVEIKTPLSAKLYAYINKPLSLEFDYLGHHFSLNGDIVLEATNKGTDISRIKEQLGKSNTYPFFFKDISIKGNENIFIPISSLNSLRNNAYELIKEFIDIENDDTLLPYESEKVSSNDEDFKMEYIYDDESVKDIIKEEGFNNKSDTKFINNRVDINPIIKNNMITNYIIEGKDLIASSYCNITNSYALDAFYSLGFKECMYSLELDYDTLNLIQKDYFNRHGVYPSTSLLLYGHIDLMIMKSCIIGTVNNNKNLHCQKCHQDKYYIKDRMNVNFPIIGDNNCNTRVLNAYPLYLLDRINDLKRIHINKGYCMFTIEGEDEILSIYNNSKDNLLFETSLMNNKYTRGHYNKRSL